MRCKDHALPGQIDVVHKRCNFDGGCTKHPTFGLIGGLQKDAVRCKDHALPGQIDLQHKRCSFEGGCTKVPSFGLVGGSAKDAVRCKDHALPGHIDIVHKRCNFNGEGGCTVQATYGTIHERQLHCAKHRLPNEWLVTACVLCKRPATYSSTNALPAQRCDVHRLVGDVELGVATCISCHTDDILLQTGKCLRCSTYTPHYKELAVRGFIEILEQKQRIAPIAPNQTRITWKIESTDKQVRGGGGCVTTRPDILLDYTYFKVIVEVDEHQHNDRPESCERTRMQGLFQEFGGFPLLFIRYNPDEYKIKGKTVATPRSKRLGELEELLNRLRNTTSLPYMFCVVYMFYSDRSHDITQVPEYSFVPV